MRKLPIVALIGQTNAGKSSILNRMARRNIAIVAREEGTTRDNVVTTIDDRFVLVDTAGLKTPADDFEASIQEQIQDAIGAADLILVTLDSTKFFDHRDAKITKDALRAGKPVLLLLNKCDLGGSLPITEFRALGIAPENTYYISAMTGRGIRELEERIAAEIGVSSKTRAETGTGANVGAKPTPIKLALVGRPNVGKSSLFNALGEKQQAIVSSRQGTTRDINRLNVRYKGKEIEILDTAGLRKPGKREVGIEKFSAIRTLAAIEEADICCLLVDSTEPHSKLDQTLAGQIVKRGRSIVVVVTKMDLSAGKADEILDDLERDFDFIPYAPVVVTSAETGQNVTRIFELVKEIDAGRHLEVKTAELNKILGEAVAGHPPAGLKNTRPKPKYIVQTDTCPPWFVVHGRELGLLHWSWKRYLEHEIRERCPFVGTPIMISYRNDSNEKRGGKNGDRDKGNSGSSTGGRVRAKEAFSKNRSGVPGRIR